MKFGYLEVFVVLGNGESLGFLKKLEYLSIYASLKGNNYFLVSVRVHSGILGFGLIFFPLVYVCEFWFETSTLDLETKLGEV